jgi:hypothetical protein
MFLLLGLLLLLPLLLQLVAGAHQLPHILGLVATGHDGQRAGRQGRAGPGRAGQGRAGPGRAGGSTGRKGGKQREASRAAYAAKLCCVLWPPTHALAGFPCCSPTQLAKHVCLPWRLVKTRAILLTYPGLAAGTEQQRAGGEDPLAIRPAQGCMAECLLPDGRAAAGSACLIFTSLKNL